MNVHEGNGKKIDASGDKLFEKKYEYKGHQYKCECNSSSTSFIKVNNEDTKPFITHMWVGRYVESCGHENLWYGAGGWEHYSLG